MTEVEWQKITMEEFDDMKLRLAKSGMKLEGHTVTICEPPAWILWENTGKKNYMKERWFLMIQMDWMSPEGRIITSRAERKKYWRYFKNVREEDGCRKGGGADCGERSQGA